MGSGLFLSDLLTGHEPGAGGARTVPVRSSTAI